MELNLSNIAIFIIFIVAILANFGYEFYKFFKEKTAYYVSILSIFVYYFKENKNTKKNIYDIIHYTEIFDLYPKTLNQIAQAIRPKSRKYFSSQPNRTKLLARKSKTQSTTATKNHPMT